MAGGRDCNLEEELKREIQKFIDRRHEECLTTLQRAY